MLAWLEADLEPSTLWEVLATTWPVFTLEGGRQLPPLCTPLPQSLGDLQMPDTDELTVSKQHRKCLWCLWFQISKIQI